jgi:hypothetical protein
VTEGFSRPYAMPRDETIGRMRRRTFHRPPHH